MSVEPLRLQASRNRRAADREQRGEEVHRLDWESSPDVSLVRAEEEDSVSPFIHSYIRPAYP
jgi:hypothetical protein